MSRLRVFHLLPDVFDPKWNWDSDPVSRLMWPISAIARHTDRSRFDLFVGTLKAPPPEAGDIPGLQLVPITTKSRADYPRAVLRLAKWLRAHQIDVMQTHLYDAGLVGLLAARLADIRVTIATGHHSHEFAVAPRSLSSVIDGLWNGHLASKMIVPSKFMRDTVVQMYRMDRGSVAVVPHGLDARRMTSSPGAREKIRRELNLQGKVVLGAAGRLFWIKQYDHLIRAFAEVCAHRPDVALVVLGGGEDREKLEALSRELGVAERVKFLGVRGDITDVLAAIDLFVHPALTESFGLVLMEAMAAGKPVVSTAVGIAPDVVGPEIGRLVHPRDQAAFAKALSEMLTISEQWPEMGARASKIAQQFTAPRMVAGYEDLYTRWHRDPAASIPDVQGDVYLGPV